MPKNNLNIEDILVDKFSEDDLIEVPLSSLAFRFFMAIILIASLIVFAQFFNLGVLNHDVYSSLAVANTTKVNTIPAPRGLILDRYDNVIVENSQIFRVYLSPGDLPKDNHELLLSLEKISEALNIDIEKIKEITENHDWHLGRPIIKDKISHEEVVRLVSTDIPGIDIQPAFQRRHSQQYAFSHIIGYVGMVTKEDLSTNEGFYVGGDEIGKMGIELTYDDVLRGNRGRGTLFMDASGEAIEERIMSNFEPGSDIETFIDRDLQEFLYNSLKNQIDALNSKGGSAIIMKPSTGEILSMVSLPSFNVNDVASYLDSPNSPFMNRSTAGRYSPGSIIKPLVALAALEEGIVSPQDRFFSSGRLVVENPYDASKPSIFHDWKEHGWVDLYSGLARSSNVYYYIVGGGHEDQEGLGISRLKKWWRIFGLEGLMGIDVPGERAGLLPDPEWKMQKVNDIWRLGDTYNVSIGQGDLELTPLSLINYINAIANGGFSYNPRVAKMAEKNINVDMRDHVDEDSINSVHRGMVDAVEKSYGTAHMLSSLPFSFAGKTGSAQVFGESTNAFFVGYSTEEDIDISILVFIEGSRDGSLNTVPVVYDSLMWYYENRVLDNSDD